MKKSYLFVLFAIACIAVKSTAQVTVPCATTEVNKKLSQLYPKSADYQKQLEDEIKAYTEWKRNPNKSSYRTTRTTTDQSANDSFWYDIPLAIHVIHNGGPELLSDNKIYQLVAEMNNFYSLNFDNSAVVPEFKQYIGKPKFRFHLAQRDPSGNPSTGITHRLSYLTYGGDEEAKMDQWAPTSYANIWFEYVIGEAVSGGIIVAYTVFPSNAAAQPVSDGIISNYSFINDAGTSNTQGGSIDHEMGHFFALYHTFGTTNSVHTNSTGNCTDDDNVDDTPPTEGNEGGCNLYDTICAKNYFKLYTNIIGGDSLVNYPDTSNEQNIMNYADCKNMFTKGQVVRMHATINSSIAGRNNLWDTTNLQHTGVWDASFHAIPKQDLKPIPEFVITPTSGGTTSNTNYLDRTNYYVGVGQSVLFHNDTWRDTLSKLVWTFSNGATSSTVTETTSTAIAAAVTNAFTTPGWVSVTMTASGNHSGDTTVTWPNALFVASTTSTPGANFYQDFSPSHTSVWPSFNYYNNGFQWQSSNIGHGDNYSMEYTGYDYRFDPTLGQFPYTGTPSGDFDDLFTEPVNLSGFTSGLCSFNFDYSGASRSSSSLDVTDELDIDYSINKGATWSNITKITKGALENKGAVSIPYTPTGWSDWSTKSIAVPTAAITNYTMFRFRYKPGVGVDGFSSGNNFYLDNVNIKPWPVSVGNVQLQNTNMAVVPNPTSGDAYVVIKDADNTIAHIIVTDVTGKVVYTITQQVTGSEAYIQIPHSAISVKGMYIIQATTGANAYTQKLVVY